MTPFKSLREPRTPSPLPRQGVMPHRKMPPPLSPLWRCVPLPWCGLCP
uniref:Uncharacterized protein n=1 Tax=Arundo donax TaxID=35708 RepID=A0A0A9EP64_ARUDO